MLNGMKTVRWILALAGLLVAGGGALAAGPARNLEIELRWSESSVSGSALAGVRDGSTVIGTAGSVSPKPLISLSTRPADDEAGGPAQRIIVLNGKSASISMSEQMPVQWLDYGVQFGAGKASGNSGSGTGSNSAANARITAVPRTSYVERTRGFVVTPNWPGGRQPVQVELKATRPQAGQGGQVEGQTQVFSTVQVALGDWITVARSGSLHPPEPGVTSSRDAEAQVSRELQLRVNLAP